MRIKFRALMFLTTFSLYGCFGGHEDVHTFVAKIKKTAAGKINELPPEKPMMKQEFTAKDLRSPFVAARRSDKIGKLSQIDGQEQGPQEIIQAPRPDATRKREFLEQFPLSEFTMVGTISKGDYVWGLVKNSDGLVFPIKVGDYIGQDSGYVMAINENQIAIEETVPNGSGGWKREMTSLDILDAGQQSQRTKQATSSRRNKSSAPGTQPGNQAQSPLQGAAAIQPQGAQK
jgi:type IV pilus assembly protein PilP